MRVKIVMGNQGFSLMCKFLEIINIFMRMIYLMLYPLMLVKMVLMTKVVDLFQKDLTIKIKIHLFQCTFIF